MNPEAKAAAFNVWATTILDAHQEGVRTATRWVEANSPLAALDDRQAVMGDPEFYLECLHVTGGPALKSEGGAVMIWEDTFHVWLFFRRDVDADTGTLFEEMWWGRGENPGLVTAAAEIITEGRGQLPGATLSVVEISNPVTDIVWLDNQGTTAHQGFFQMKIR